MRRAGTVLAATVFVAVLVATFPSDGVVRWAVARALPPGAGSLAFARAHLRPWAVRLEDVSLRAADGRPLASLEWLTLSPSLAGLFRDRSGRPWRLRGAACGGTFAGSVEPDDTLALRWRDVDLARCSPSALAGGRITGIVGGRARLGPGPAGEGQLRLSAATWTAAEPFLPGLAAVHADEVGGRWTIGAGRVALTDLVLRGPEIAAHGGGTVELAASAVESRLDLLLGVAPGPRATPLLRDLIGRLPTEDGTGARAVAVRGTLTRPRLEAAP
jgi:type II secretion system protein N